jgi:hypothetical protein
MGRRGLVRFDYPAHQNPQVLKASEYNLSPQAHTSSGNPADDYEVFDSNRRVVGRIMLHPQATKDLPWFLDDNGSRNPTISPQSRIFSDPRTGDGGF